jgi:mono/diheme cytochrome c family protein
MRPPALLIAALMVTPAGVHAEGAELYEIYCSNCHGKNAEMLNGVVGTPERFREILEGATEDMPDFYGVFEPEQVEALYEYVATAAAAIR